VSRLARLAFAGLALGCAATPAFGQSVGARLVAADADHPLLGGMFGGRAELGVRLQGSSVGFRFGVEHLIGTGSRMGVACGGFVDPGSCPPERLHDRATLTAAAFGASLDVVTDRSLDLALIADFAVGRVGSSTRGLTTGNRLSAAKATGRFEVGAELGWRPAAGRSARVALGAGAGRQFPFHLTYIADGYTPFESGFRTVRLWLGVSSR
jgi:hypothetical protein